MHMYSYIFIFTDRLPWKLSGKESTCQAEYKGSILGWGRSPGEGNGNPLQYSCLEKSHGHGSLVRYGPCGRSQESDMPLRLNQQHQHQHSCLRNLTDRGAWWATVHTVPRV